MKCKKLVEPLLPGRYGRATDNLDARIIFTPKPDGTCRIAATSNTPGCPLPARHPGSLTVWPAPWFLPKSIAPIT
jgi:hypothetical protein